MSSSFDEDSRAGRGYYWSRSTYLGNLGQESGDSAPFAAVGGGSGVEATTIDFAAAAAVRHVASAPQNLKCGVEVMHLGGAVVRRAPSDTAFWCRQAPFEVHAIASWDVGVEDSSAAVDFAKSFSRVARDFGDGAGGGYLPSECRQCFGARRHCGSLVAGPHEGSVWRELESSSGDQGRRRSEQLLPWKN